MPITREQAVALAELVCIVRPRWNTRGVIARGLGPLAKHPAPLEVIAWAALRAAADPTHVDTPAGIPLNGPHWNLADRPPAPRLTPEHECPHHPGQWADLCRSCHADRIALDDDPDDTAGDTPRDGAIARAKHAAQLAKHAGQGTHDDDQDDDVTAARESR